MSEQLGTCAVCHSKIGRDAVLCGECGYFVTQPVPAPAEPAEYTCPRCGSNVSTHICMGEPVAGEPKDNVDYCLVCGKEIPPGPDCCSPECDKKYLRIEIKKAALEQLNSEAKSAKIHWSGHGHTTQWWVNKAVQLQADIIERAGGQDGVCPVCKEPSICDHMGWEYKPDEKLARIRAAERSSGETAWVSLGFEVERFNGEDGVEVLIRDTDSPEWTSGLAWAKTSPETIVTMLADVYEVYRRTK